MKWKQVVENLKSYKRQYVGLILPKEGHVVWINSFNLIPENWKKEWVSVKGGGAHYFNARVNLEKKECVDLWMNASK